MLFSNFFIGYTSAAGVGPAKYFTGLSIWPTVATGPNATKSFIFEASSLFWPNWENPIIVPFEIKVMASTIRINKQQKN